MADEPVQPLTAGEIAEVRDRWTRAETLSQLREGAYLACMAAADDILRLLVSFGISEAERDKARASLDAWRPVLEAVAASPEYPDEALEITGIRTRARHALGQDSDEEAAWRLAKAAASDASDARMYADAEYFWQQVAESEGSPAPDEDE